MEILNIATYLHSEGFAQEVQLRNLPYTKILLLDHLPVAHIKDQMQDPDFNKIVINLYVGMGSVGRKIAPEVADLSFVPPHIPQYEPWDVRQLWEILEQG